MTAGNKVAVDFEEIIKADRQRRQNELLAQQIFGKGRRANGPGAAQGLRKPGSGPSLASRVGVAKRSASYSNSLPTTTKGIPAKRTVKPPGNVDADWTHDLHESDSPATTRNPQPNRRANAEREDLMHKALNVYKALKGSSSSPALNNQFNIVSKPKPTGGIFIRGLAGPSTVVAENFAPGTTAADIESAMSPFGGTILKCSVTSSASTVIAELVFETKDGADNVISQFHNQTADGRVLSLYHKSSPTPAKTSNARLEPTSVAPPLGPRADRRYATSDRYEPRERSREKRDYDRDDVVDGSYGFEDVMDTDGPEDNRTDGNKNRGLYSDDLFNKRSGRSNGGRGYRDNWDGGRGGDGGRNRGRGYR